MPQPPPGEPNENGICDRGGRRRARGRGPEPADLSIPFCAIQLVSARAIYLRQPSGRDLRRPPCSRLEPGSRSTPPTRRAIAKKSFGALARAALTVAVVTAPYLTL